MIAEKEQGSRLDLAGVTPQKRGNTVAKPQVLVVEDEAIVAEDLRTLLEGLGYMVPAVVSSGEEALQKAAETHPDVVLMDIVLKGEMDGVEAADQIRARRNVPVVFLTAYSDPNTARRAIRTEPFGYLVKPFEERELYTTIQLALYKHKREQKRKERQPQATARRKQAGRTVILTGEMARREGGVTESMGPPQGSKGRLRQLVRCHQILERLASPRIRYDANLLAEELGFTTKTIYRDLRALKEAGISVEYDRPRKRYVVEKGSLARPFLLETRRSPQSQKAGLGDEFLGLTATSRYRGHEGQSCAKAIRAVMRPGEVLTFSELFSKVKQMGTWSDYTIWQHLMALAVNLRPARDRWTTIKPFLFLHEDGRYERYDPKVHPASIDE